MTISIVHEYTTTGAGENLFPDVSTWFGVAPGDVGIITIEETTGQNITGVSYNSDGKPANWALLGTQDGLSGSTPRAQIFAKKLTTKDFTSGAFRQVTLDNHIGTGKKQITIIHSDSLLFSSDPAEFAPISYRHGYNSTPSSSSYTVYDVVDTTREMAVFCAISFGSSSNGGNLQTRWDGIDPFADPYWDNVDTFTNAHQMDRKLYQASDVLDKLEFTNQGLINKAVLTVMIQTHVSVTRLMSGKGNAITSGTGRLRLGNFTGYGPTIARGKGFSKSERAVSGRAVSAASGFGFLKATRSVGYSKSISVARGTGSLFKNPAPVTFEIKPGSSI